MQEKKMDLIILNSLNDKRSCFSHDTNKITIIDQNLNIKENPLMTKKEVAIIIFNEILFQKSSLVILTILSISAL